MKENELKRKLCVMQRHAFEAIGGCLFLRTLLARCSDSLAFLSMSEYVVRLPAFVFEKQLPAFVAHLLDAKAGNPERIVLDFERIKFYIPAAIVTTLALVKHWVGTGQKVTFRNHSSNPVCGYLQRIDFFKQVGLELPETGQRQDSKGRFVPIEEISAAAGHPDTIASKLAEVVAPGGFMLNEAFPLMQYAAGEIVTNCKQHAKGIGFTSGQFVESTDWARIAIADCGRGILKSFEENESPHYKLGMSHMEAITAALQPRVSSTTHLPHAYGSSPNKGVGLSMVTEMTSASFGHMIVISGDSWAHKDGRRDTAFGKLNTGLVYPGTIVAASFLRGQIGNYAEILTSAKAKLGLTANQPVDILFE